MRKLLLLIGTDGTEREIAYNDRQPGSLKFMQDLLGGYLESVHVLWEGAKRQAFVDEDGLSKRLPFNRKATVILRGSRVSSEVGGIVGPMIILLPTPKETTE